MSTMPLGTFGGFESLGTFNTTGKDNKEKQLEVVRKIDHKPVLGLAWSAAGVVSHVAIVPLATYSGDLVVDLIRSAGGVAIEAGNLALGASSESAYPISRFAFDILLGSTTILPTMLVASTAITVLALGLLATARLCFENGNYHFGSKVEIREVPLPPSNTDSVPAK